MQFKSMKTTLFFFFPEFRMMGKQVLIGTAFCTDGSCYCAEDLGTGDTLSDSSLISCLK